MAAVQSDPSFVEAHLQFAETLRAAGRFQNSLSEYEATIRLDPRRTEARLGTRWHSLAWVGTTQPELSWSRLRSCFPITRNSPTSWQSFRDLADYGDPAYRCAGGPASPSAAPPAAPGNGCPAKPRPFCTGRLGRMIPFLRSSSIARSSARSADRMFSSPWLPSWHSYGSNMPP